LQEYYKQREVALRTVRKWYPAAAGESPSVTDRCVTLITLTRLNNSRFVVNAELIRTIEERPDTTIVLVNGETLIVKEPMEQVVAKAVEYGRMVRMFPG